MEKRCVGWRTVKSILNQLNQILFWLHIIILVQLPSESFPLVFKIKMSRYWNVYTAKKKLKRIWIYYHQQLVPTMCTTTLRFGWTQWHALSTQWQKIAKHGKSLSSSVCIVLLLFPEFPPSGVFSPSLQNACFRPWRKHTEDEKPSLLHDLLSQHLMHKSFQPWWSGIVLKISKESLLPD